MAESHWRLIDGGEGQPARKAAEGSGALLDSNSQWIDRAGRVHNGCSQIDWGGGVRRTIGWSDGLQEGHLFGGVNP
jgi:hypothetical protein